MSYPILPISNRHSQFTANGKPRRKDWPWWSPSLFSGRHNWMGMYLLLRGLPGDGVPSYQAWLLWKVSYDPVGLTLSLDPCIQYTNCKNATHINMGFPTALVILQLWYVQDEKHKTFPYTDSTVSSFYCLNITIKSLEKKYIWAKARLSLNYGPLPIIRYLQLFSANIHQTRLCLLSKRISDYFHSNCWGINKKVSSADFIMHCKYVCAHHLYI